MTEKTRLEKWFVTRPALRFLLIILACLFGEYNALFFAIGTALLLPGAALHLWAKGTLQQNVQLIVTGPYRYCRHPFYLSYAIIDIAIIFLSGNLWLFLLFFPLWAFVYKRQIKIEDSNLQALFGGQFTDYARRVPVLLPFGKATEPPCAVKFTWSNPNLTKHGEIPRLIRLSVYPLLLYLSFRLHEKGWELFHKYQWTDILITLALLCLFFFSRLLVRPLRRRKRILPLWSTAQQTRLLVIAVLLILLSLTDSLKADYSYAAWATVFSLIILTFLLVFLGFKKPDGLFELFFLILICLLLRQIWIIPVITLYYSIVISDLIIEHRNGDNLVTSID
ncbi:MAG: isoprenylcysteine carboxylmethyltransferase family protein [Planctomycetota bacterium]